MARVRAEELSKVQKWAKAVTGAGRIQPFVRIECRKQGFGSLQWGRSIMPGPLRLAGKEYDAGLGTHADSELVVRSSAPIRRFSAVAGIDDNALTRVNDIRMAFSVEAGGKKVWSAGPLKVSDAPARVEVALDGAREFVLKVREVNGVLHAAHANWCAAKVETVDGTVIELGRPSAEWLYQDAPVDFRYGGKPAANLLGAWEKRVETREAGDGVTVCETRWRDPETGLECVLEMKHFADFAAAEWVWRFRNGGGKDTPILEDIRGLDVTWPMGAAPTVRYSQGSLCRIDDFILNEETIETGKAREFVTGGGRSSQAVLPFFNLMGKDEGLIVGVGWTGQWASRFSFDGCLVRVEAGMERTHLTLHPGEEIRTPRMLILYWQGESMRGHNELRQFILKYHTYRPDGRTIPAPITTSTWGGMKSSCHLDRIAVMKEHGLDHDYYWIDAGWYGPADSYSPDEFEGDWYKHVGNWSVNPAAHPNGLRPLSDAAKDAGMKFLLWFEPERAIWGTPLTQEHPEWFLGEKKELMTVLLNLGIPEARRWITDLIVSKIEEFGVDCYRQDFNMDPLAFWRSNDAPDRVGMTEIRHIEGLYEFWDALLARCPGLLIDNCASGGRRIDLETIGRSIPLWRSDVQCWPSFDTTASQVHTHGLAHWVPCSTTGAQMRPGDTYNFRSAMCTGIQFPLFSYEKNPIDPNYPWAWHRERLAEMRRAIPYYFGDYYPLTACSVSAELWMAYQMHREDLGEGIFVAFRREKSPFLAARFPEGSGGEGDIRVRGRGHRAGGRAWRRRADDRGPGDADGPAAGEPVDVLPEEVGGTAGVAFATKWGIRAGGTGDGFWEQEPLLAICHTAADRDCHRSRCELSLLPTGVASGWTARSHADGNGAPGRKENVCFCGRRHTLPSGFPSARGRHTMTRRSRCGGITES